MNETASRLVNHLFLWHCTLSENAEAIVSEGFRLGRHKVVYFFQSAIPFLNMVNAVDQAKCNALFCAIDLDSYNLGCHYSHQMTDVFIFYIPLPKDVIVARFNLANVSAPAELKRVLSAQLQCDVSKTFSEICANEAIRWNQLTSIAGALRELDEKSYHDAEVTKRLIREEIEAIDEQECERIFSLFIKSNQWFQQMFLDLYYGKYAFPHFARAIMVAGARFVHPIQVLAFCDPTVVIPVGSKPRKRPDDASVAALLAEVLPKLSREELVFGIIEMMAMRKFSGNEIDLKVIENWLAQHGSDAEEVAFHFIRFGHHSAVIRRGGNAVRMAAAILKGTGKDYFERLSSLTKPALERSEGTDSPPHSTLIQAFGLLRTLVIISL
ncbi:TPA: hypothetical protein EYP66_10400 [Candidatus Poribacteria bacterium]|nr:hypothetical protein [Candidatus Poribacteria bacterium]